MTTDGRLGIYGQRKRIYNQRVRFKKKQDAHIASGWRRLLPGTSIPPSRMIPQGLVLTQVITRRKSGRSVSRRAHATLTNMCGRYTPCFHNEYVPLRLSSVLKRVGHMSTLYFLWKGCTALFCLARDGYGSTITGIPDSVLWAARVPVPSRRTFSSTSPKRTVKWPWSGNPPN